MTLPIEDYALIGDCKTAASVGRLSPQFLYARKISGSFNATYGAQSCDGASSR
jgi:hypothetical protein